MPIALVAKLKNGTIIPVDVNQFRNSNLGIKPIKYNCDIENDATNKAEKIWFENEIKYAEENPYHSDALNIDIKIITYLTMVINLQIAAISFQFKVFEVGR